jgi:hypothetical protein
MAQCPDDRGDDDQVRVHVGQLGATRHDRGLTTRRAAPGRELDHHGHIGKRDAGEVPSDMLEPGKAIEPRAGDSDREAVAERLRVAAGEGRIDLAELDERLGRTYQARTYRELDVLVADLPELRPGMTPAEAAAVPDPLVLQTTWQALKQVGPWPVPGRIIAETRTGHMTIDFTQAVCAHREITVEAVCRSGWIKLILPADWAARIGPASTNTGHISKQAVAPAGRGRPAVTVTVTGHPKPGHIKIRQRRPGRAG